MLRRRDATPLGLWGGGHAKRSGNPPHARPSRPRTCKQKTRILPGMLRHGMLRQWDGTPSGFATHQALWQSAACSPIPPAHVQAKNADFAWHVTPPACYANGTEPRRGSQRAKRSGNPPHARPSRPRTCKQKTRILPGMLRHDPTHARPSRPRTCKQKTRILPGMLRHRHVTPMGRNPVGVRNAPSGPAIRRTLAHPGRARASKKRGFCLACYATGMLRHRPRTCKQKTRVLPGM